MMAPRSGRPCRRLTLWGWLEDRWQANGFAFGARGWGYFAEVEGIIKKGELDAFETWLSPGETLEGEIPQ